MPDYTEWMQLAIPGWPLLFDNGTGARFSMRFTYYQETKKKKKKKKKKKTHTYTLTQKNKLAMKMQSIIFGTHVI